MPRPQFHTDTCIAWQRAQPWDASRAVHHNLTTPSYSASTLNHQYGHAAVPHVTAFMQVHTGRNHTSDTGHMSLVTNLVSFCVAGKMAWRHRLQRRRVQHQHQLLLMAICSVRSGLQHQSSAGWLVSEPVFRLRRPSCSSFHSS